MVPHECVDQSAPYMGSKGWGDTCSSMDATGEIELNVESSFVVKVLFKTVYIFFIFCFSIYKVVEFVKGKIPINKK